MDGSDGEDAAEVKGGGDASFVATRGWSISGTGSPGCAGPLGVYGDGATEEEEAGSTTTFALFPSEYFLRKPAGPVVEWDLVKYRAHAKKSSWDLVKYRAHAQASTLTRSPIPVLR